MKSLTADKPSSSKYVLTLLLLLITFLYPIGSIAQNPIVTENNLPGTPQSVWDVSGAGDLSIQGFATSISVNKGDTIRFKINTDASAYTIDIYRLGYYQGNGARKTGTGIITASLPQTQPAGLEDPSTGLLDCGNWAESGYWAVPSNAVSGVYLAKLTRTDDGGASHIVFIVRDDTNHSALYFKTSDATWQAYNVYGGNSLYVGTTSYPSGHAAKVSYNRPFITRNGGGGGGAEEDWVFNAEYPMIRWLERNGYDVTYTTDVDAARYGSLLLNHKVFMSVGHDEYWSGEEYDNVMAARSAGVNLAFFSGNEIYWKTRWENSVDVSNTPYRTLVCYKEGTLGENSCGDKCDPLPNVWTGLWRDGCSYPLADGCKPENSLSGQISWDGTQGDIEVPDTYKNYWFWRNTSIASLGIGQTATLTSGTLGYEWDWQQYTSSYPAGRIMLSSTVQNSHIHHLSLYRASSGALVFGAGTVQWSWGLDSVHDRGNDSPSRDMQQATVNLFADMGVQPANLQSNLVAATKSTDTQAPVSVISSPNGAVLANNKSVTITGTASDNHLVAGVDISIDSGATWLPANGTTNWSYSWVPTKQGPVTIMSRGFDDNGNIETTITSSNVIIDTVGPPSPVICPCTVFQPTDTAIVPLANDNPEGIELGMKFRTTENGYITGIRFYKGPGTKGTHLGHLWSNNSLLAEAMFTSETPSGWQEAEFIPPVQVYADSTYVISYHSSSGDYSYTDNYFTTDIVNGPIIGLADGESGANGVYRYTSEPAYPDNTYQSSNYWVDAVFNTTVAPDTTLPRIISSFPAANATGISITAPLSTTFNEGMDVSTINTSTCLLFDSVNNPIAVTVNYNPGTHTAIITPSSPMAYLSNYKVTIKGGISYDRVKDLAGNAMAKDSTWTFKTEATPPPPPPPPIDGPGGPILVIGDSANPFSRYTAEILRAEGFNEFDALNIPNVTTAILNAHDVAVLGQIPLTPSEVTMLTNWVDSGGTLIAFRPDAQLASLMGITSTGNKLGNGYLLVNTASGPGVGIVNQTIQFHDTADLYNLSGATVVATLYSDANTATPYPAVTMKSVGTKGGKAIAFTYDLSRSIVYTRQGNPAWAGQKRDGQIDPIRPDDMFFPNWIDFSKIAIPQADEQQHLLSNIITDGDLHRKPLPRFWFLPKGLKAAIVMTGDNHGDAGMQPRFDINITESTPGCSVDDWDCIRSTGYEYVGSIFTDSMAKYYNNLGFEVALHVNTGCANYTQAEYDDYLTTQYALFGSTFPDIPKPTTNRNHCIAWSGWSMTAEEEAANGIRLDANYYYWPGSWVNNTPGMFTGSGLPMRFAKEDGTLIDCYQLVTQMPDESEEVFPAFCDALLDKAVGPEGYYGVFTTNMHFDNPDHPDANAVVASAQAHHIPVVTAKQMLTWLDGRNNSSFNSLLWNSDTLKFSVTAASGSRNLNAMIPTVAASGHLESILLNNTPVTYTVQTIKGVEYAFVPTSGGNYAAIYDIDTVAPVITNIVATPHYDGTATITWTTNEAADSKVEFGLTPASLTSNDSNSTQLTSHSVTLSGLTQGTTYYFRVMSKDAGNNLAISPDTLSSPLTFVMPGNFCAEDVYYDDFNLGKTDSNTSVILDGGDGGVILKPAFYDDFMGSSLSAAWQTGVWSPGGADVVAGGNLVVDGASAATIKTFGPGSSLQFKATFSSTTFQNLGFAADAAFDPPWVTIGEGNTAGTLYLRDDLGTNIALGSGLVGSEHYYRIDWNATGFTVYVDSVQVATLSKTVASSMVAIASDFNTGDGTLQVNWLRVTPYADSGTYTSRVFDHSDTTKWGKITWNADIPAGTGLSISVRTGNTPAPDASWTNYFTVANGDSIDSVSRYIQYRAYLSTTDSSLTPSLNDIGITCSSNNYTCVPPMAYISAVNASVCSGSGIQLRLDSATGMAPYTLVVNDTTYTNVNPGQNFATLNYGENSIWGNTGTPNNPNGNDGLPIEVGVKFRSSVDGFVTGVRFYKGTLNTGTHIGSLWTKNGTKLASATFTSETASGWQEVHFATPVSIHADSTYIASYYSAGGTFAITPFYFTTNGVTNGPLTALQTGVDGPNGVYVYGGGFPTGGNDANYWVDVVFEKQLSGPQVYNYTLTSVKDAKSCSDTGANLATVSVTVNPLPTGTISSAGPVCKDQDVSLVFNSTSGTGPFSLIINDTTYTNVGSGVPFNTGKKINSAPVSIWDNATIPGTQSVLIDSAAIEVGVKFRSSVSGTITGIRFYKGSLNKGLHTGSLWTSTGVLLATDTFATETPSGWQQLLFSKPVNITANTTYIASYHADSGRYAYDAAYFTSSGHTNYPLTALQNGVDGSNGVYVYSNGGVFPNQSFNSANYWVDVLFQKSDSNVFTLSQITDANGCSVIPNGNSVQVNVLDSVKASIASRVNVSCHGSSNGSATVSASGGSGTFSYLWSDGSSQTSAIASGLSAGTYTVTVTDKKGCNKQATDTVVITEPAAITATTGHKDALCNGGNTGMAFVNASGGTGAFTYSWSNGGNNDTITYVSAGTYIITVTDANGCTFKDSALVGEPAAISATTGHKDALCNGGNTGMAFVNASGGTGAFTYSWSNGGNNDTITYVSAGTYIITVTDANGCTFKDSTLVGEPTALTLSFNAHNVLCFGNNTGSVRAIAGGGTAPYSYLWAMSGSTKDSISSLTTGTYSVTLTDSNGCVVNGDAFINQPASALSVIMKSIHGSCIGGTNGSACVTASGGTGSYTYTWANGNSNDTISSVSAGIYSIVVQDSNGCLAKDSVVIKANALPVVNISGNIIGGAQICAGKTDTLTANVTGTAPFKYKWSNSGSNDTILVKTSNVYSIMVTDSNGCLGNASINVTVNPLPVVTVKSVPANDSICAGSEIALSGKGAKTYSWTGGITDTVPFIPASSGQYIVTGTDNNGCVNTDTVNVVVNPLPLIIISGKDSIAPGTIDTLTASGSSVSYIWSTGSTADTTIVAPLSNITYTVTGISAHGCKDTAKYTIAVGFFTVVNDINEPDGTLVYPNPANEEVFLKFALNGGPLAATLKISDAAGKEIMERNVTITNGQAIEINVSGLPAGMYFIRVTTGQSGKVVKFIKQ